MKFFSKKEGVLTSILGLKKIQALDSYHSVAINKKIGDRAVFAKNGGKSIFNLFMYNVDRAKLLADIRRVEKLIEIKVK